MMIALDRLTCSMQLCALALLFALVGVRAPVALAESAALGARKAADSEVFVDIPDAALRRIVREQLRLAESHRITRDDMAKLTRLVYHHRYYAPEGYRVRQLAGLEHATNLQSLALTHHDFSDLSPLAELTSLTVLHVGSKSIRGLSPLAGLTSLRELGLRDTRNLNLSPLARLTSLTELDLTASEIADPSPLAELTSLTTLHLSGSDISDLSPLAKLTSLTTLNLADARNITDVSPLAGLTSLTALDLKLDANPRPPGISDVSSLAGLTSLETLNLAGHSSLSDVSPLADLTSLNWLQLYSCNISDLGPLSGLTALTVLGLGLNSVEDMAPLLLNDGLGEGDVVGLSRNPLGLRSRMTHIPALIKKGATVHWLYADEVPEIAEIPDPGLRHAVLWAGAEWSDHEWSQEWENRLLRLDASRYGVEALTGVEELASLQLIFLDRNKITDVGPLADLGSLRVLTLSHNMVRDWTPLANMESLYYLALDGNSLRDVPPLPNLLYLYLADNSISSVAPLADQPWLRELDLSGNAITSLAPLARVPLRHLDVDDNEVNDLSPLSFGSLRELQVRNNAVRDISPLLKAEDLLVVDVRRNPLADDALAVLDTLRERRVTVLAGETVPYFPAAGEGRQGFVRIVNRGEADGHVFIEAVDDAGVRAGPVRVDVGARRAVHFNSTDLEHGNVTKGLGGVGAPTAGAWRLEVISALDVEVLSYIRTEDGFVTAMHDVAADAMAPFFNPGSNENQRSILRVVNTEAEPAKWTTGGYDDGGKWHPMAGSLLVRPQHALTLTAQALENTHGLGDGRGKWRLRVRGFPWFAMSLLESPTGHLTNLSTTPDNATPLEDGGTLHRLPLFPAAGGSRQGFVRVINRSFTSSGEVVIRAVDDAGARSGPVQLVLRPLQAVHFNSADLENGNAAKGLDGGVGVGEGDWRLELTSELDLTALSYARTEDGFLTSLHDVAAREEDGTLWIPFFNPGSNRNQVSHLRLMNWGDAPAEVRITGIDDAGRSPGDAVDVTIPARAARQFTAAELEAGSNEELSGALGDGQGKWRLHVATSEEVDAMSLLSLPTDHMTNLSTTPRYPLRQSDYR